MTFAAPEVAWCTDNPEVPDARFRDRPACRPAGAFSGDELLAGTDSANPNSFPGSCPADLDASGAVDAGDISIALLDFGPCQGCPSDLDANGAVDGGDLSLMLLAFGPCP